QVLKQDLTVTLSNGDTVVIKAGTTETPYELKAQGDDVYKDGQTVEVGVTDAAVDGKSFENLVLGDKATVTIGDTISEVTATLSVDKTTVTEGGSVTYTVTLTNAAGLPMANHGELTFKLSDGTTITVPANSTTGSATVVTTNDIFTGGQPSLVNKLESVSGAEQFEQLTLGQDEYTTTVTDQPTGEGDQITVTIESNGDVLENAAPKFTVKVDQVLKQDLTVTLSNGDTVVIKAGTTETPYELKAQGDDVYKDGQTVEVGVTDAVIDGKSFENLVLGDKAAVTIGDTISEVTATLTVDKTTVTEGGSVTYTVTLTNAAGLPMSNHGELTFKLSDGTTITVPANSTTGSATVVTSNDIFTGGQPSLVNKLESVSGAEQFEQLTLGQDEYTTTVTDQPAGEGDKITVTIESNGNVLEDAAPKFTVKVDQVLKQDLTVTLSNGDTVVIKAGTTETPYELKAQGDDVYKDGQIVEVGVTDAVIDGKSFENLVLGDKAAVTIGDTVTEVVATLTVDKTTVTEGGQITYTVTLTNAAGLPMGAHGPLEFTLSDGTVVKIPANGTSGTATVTANDDIFTGGQPAIVNKLESVSGAEQFEQLTLNDTTLITSVTDEPGSGDPTDPANEGDKIIVTIESNGNVLENAAPKFTVKVDQVLKQDLTVTLSNGDTVVIKAGTTETPYELKAQGDDVYKDGQTIEVGVTDAVIDGKSFENLVLGDKAAVTIGDTVTEVVATLTVDKTTVTEGGSVTYTVTLTNAAGLPMANHGELTFKLSDGTTITVPANSTTGSASVTANDDIFTGGQPAIVNKLESVSGAEQFEQLTLNDTTLTTSVTDEPGSGDPTDPANEGDKITVTIESNGDVLENAAPKFTVKVDQVLKQDLTVTLSNGDTVVIKAGTTETPYELKAQGDDVYKDGQTIEVGITDAAVDGKSFENLVLGDKATVTIGDTISEVTATLSVDKTTVTEGGSVTYTVTLTNAAGLPMANHGELTFKLSDGTTITVPANSTTGSATVVTSNDIFTGGQPSLVNKLESVSGAEQFEQLTLGQDEYTTTVTDQPTGEGDQITVTIESNGDVLENAAPKFTVKVDQVLKQDLTVTLSNGDTVVIKAGTTETPYELKAQGDDVYKDGQTIEVGVTDAVIDGKSFENLVLGDKAAVTIGDTISEVTATLTVDKTTVTEGGSVTYTVTLTNAAGLPMSNHGELTFKLSDGTTITVPANSTTGSATVVTSNDIFTGGQPSLVNKLESVSGAEQFEQLTLGQDEYTTTVTDQPTGEGDQITVTIESNGDVLENAAPKFTVKVDQVLKQDLTVTLSNGDTVVIKAGTTETPYELKAQGDDVYKDGQIVEVGVTDAIIDGKSFENLVLGDKAAVTIGDTISEVTATLTVDKTTVTEGGSVTYTVTLTNAAGLPMSNHGELTFKLSDGTTITVPANSTIGSATVVTSNDIFTGGQPSLVNKLESVSGAEQFEKLTLGQDQYTTTVTDQPTGEGDKITVTIESNGDVLENAAPKFTVKVDQVLKQDLTVTLSNGDTVVIKAGTTETPYELKAQGDDVYKDGQTVEVGVTDATVDGKSFENLALGDKAAVTIGDTVTEVVATLTVDKTTVTEGGQITYTVTLTNAAGLPMGAHGPLEFTLSDGTVVKIPANGTSGTASITVNDDIFTGGQPAIVNKLESVSGAEQFEQLTLNDTTLTTSVTDEPGSGDPTDPANEGDQITVTIESNGNVLENAAPKFTVKVDQVLKQDLTVTLSNGDTVVIKAGTTETPYELKAQGDDVYKDGQTIDVGLTDAAVDGKSFENLVLGDKATVTIGDTISEVTATLTVDKTTVTEGGSVTYTVTLTNAAGLPMSNHGELTFKLSDGTTITVPANSTTGSATVVTSNDIFTGGQPSLVNKLESVSGAEQFEKLTLGQDEYTTTVTDQPTGEGDKITVTIESNGDVLEDAAPKFTVKVDQVLKQDLTVTLSNGDTVVIKAGTTETPYELKAQGDDVYKDGQTVEVGLDNATVDGKSFENLVLGDKATVTIGDTISEVTATLTVDKTTVTEGGSVTYTVTLTNAAGLPMANHGELTFKLSDGTTITVPANSTTGSASVTANDDIFTGGQPAIVNKLESVSGAEQFEQLTLKDTTLTTTVTDEPGSGDPTDPANEGDKITVTIESNGDVLENAAPKFTVKVDQVLKQDLTVTLSNGDTVVIKAGTTETPYELKAQGDDVYKDGQTVEVGIDNATVDGKSFENLVLGDKATVTIGDTISEVTATLTVDKTTVTEGGQVTYTVTLTNAAGLPMGAHGPLAFTLSDGTVVKIPANGTSGTASITVNDDIFTGGQPAIVNKLESVSGAEQFEQLTLGQDKYTTVVTDEPGSGDPTNNEGDKITVTIESNGNVLEDAAPKFTVKVDQVLKQDLTVTLSNGDTVVIKAGTTETPYELKAQGDDVYKDGQTIDVGLTDAAVDGKSFENLVLG
ncbi:immunoglobulin-like domain-containing protein, partial [Pseudomonas sp. Irchel s3b6]